MPLVLAMLIATIAVGPLPRAITIRHVANVDSRCLDANGQYDQDLGDDDLDCANNPNQGDVK